MAGTNHTPLLLTCFVLLFFFCRPAAAFGAGNIPSIARIEGGNFRHGDIEDVILGMAFLKGKKWTPQLLKRVYFGNWLRDYSQAIDVGTLKGVNAGTIRVLVWVLSFMSFGYATGEFEVTAERLGCYRPEEHIDNPKDYADNLDARVYDERLRPPVHPQELAMDPYTGMKNYIANESGGWATSSGYVKHSLTRSIYFGRKYCAEGLEEDLNEALRCLGQALHTLEDFSAHSNYVELVLHELGLTSVFPHVGSQTQMYIRGKTVWPLVTGTFGGVDFLHSVLGEAQDKFMQSEIEAVNETFTQARAQDQDGSQASVLRELLNQIPGAGGLGAEADALEARSQERDRENKINYVDPSQYGSRAAAKSSSFDAEKVAQDIYPILEFRDKVVRTISGIIAQIPGLTELFEAISEQITIFVFSILAPYIQPIIAQANEMLKTGSTEVIESSASHQFDVWTNTTSTDPTHSMISKDHFSNILNQPAGKVAIAVVEYVVPRVVYAWEHPHIHVQQVLDDVVQVLHHPGLRNPNSEVQANMFNVVREWFEAHHDRGAALAYALSSEGVRTGKNHTNGVVGGGGCGGHGHTKDGEWHKAEKVKKGKKDKKDKDKKKIGILGGVQLPGVLGEVVGAVAEGFAQGQQGVYDEKKKDKKKKDKDYDDYDEDKKKKKDKEYKYDEYGNKIKEKKDKDEKKYKYDEYGNKIKDKKKDKYDDDDDDDGDYKKKKDKKDKKDKDKKDKKKKKDKSRSYSDDDDDDEDSETYVHSGDEDGGYYKKKKRYSGEYGRRGGSRERAYSPNRHHYSSGGYGRDYYEGTEYGGGYGRW